MLISTWTPWRDAQMAELLALKFSARQVAVILGVTRNAAIGRARRIGLSVSSNPENIERARRSVESRRFNQLHPALRVGPHPNKPRKRVLRPRPKQKKLTAKAVVFNVVRVPLRSYRAQPAPPFVYTGPGYLYADVPERGCMFYVSPVMDEPTLFCGEPKAEGKPYCVGHWRMAHQPLQSSQARREPGYHDFLARKSAEGHAALLVAAE